MRFFSWGFLRSQYLLLGILVLVPPLLIWLPAGAQSNSSIAQQFQTVDNDIATASLVSIEKDNPHSVTLSNTEQADRLVGVVGNKPLIELSDGVSGISVVTSGITMALVSDLNSKVVAGDKITASPISGIGMKATESTVIVGTAQAALSSVETEVREVTDRAGNKQAVNIGLIPVQVGVVFYAPEKRSPSAFVPPFLQSLANTISGREISPVRVLVAAMILLLLFLSITVLLYSSIRSSIISIGRNPLSASAVRRSLIEVGFTVFAMLLFTVAIVYLVLTL